MQHLRDGPRINVTVRKSILHMSSLRNHTGWASVLWSDIQLESNFKNDHITSQQKTDTFCHCKLHLHGQRGMQQGLHWICVHYCWWKAPAPTPEWWRDILLSTACRATLHPSLYKRRGEGEGRRGQAGVSLL